MNSELLTLAIHTVEKAKVLKHILESNGMEVFMEEIENSQGYNVKVKIGDLSRALTIIEANRLFRYDDTSTYAIDDGRSRILVAVDFSDYSLKACQTAFNIAKEVNAKVKILHVYHDMYFPSHIPFSGNLKDKAEEGLLNKTRKQMLDLCIDIDKKISNGQWPSVNYSYSLREGVVEEEIENFVLEYKPSLLVLGTKGKDNNQNNILGNVTADVIEITNVPVLAVPENSSIQNISDIKHIAFLTNIQDRDLSSFELLVNIFKENPLVKITFVHINKPDKKENAWPESELIQISDNFGKHYPQMNVSYKLISSQNIEKAINNFVKEEKINIISLTTRRRNIFRRIFNPSLSRKILFNNEISLFVFRG